MRAKGDPISKQQPGVALESGGVRVAFVTEVTGWGGSETYLAAIVASAVERGWQAHVFCPSQHPFLTDPARALPTGCAVTPFAFGLPAAVASDAAPGGAAPGRGPRGLFRKAAPSGLKVLAGAVREARRVGRVLRGMNFDLLYFGIIGCPHLALGLRRAVRSPMVGRFCVLPSDLPKDTDFAHRALEWASARCFDELIANSRYARDSWVRRVRIAPRRLHLVYNGVPAERFRPQRPAATVRQELGLAPDSRVITVTARLDPGKGHSWLFAALPQIAGEVAGVRLLVLGDGPIRAALEAECRRLGILGNVMFLGHRADMPDVLQLSDVSVLPTLWDCLPYTLIEAMALGKPVVASRVGGIPEMVEDHVTGTLVPPANANALADAIIDLLKHPEKVRAFGEAGRRRVEEKFALRRMLDETFALFEHVLTSKQRGSR